MRRLNKTNEASPLYAQIADDIRYKIYSDEWQTGTKIPPELNLCELYNVSRITVRKAIDELVRENLLYRERAKGTFVRDVTDQEDEHFTLVKSFTREMQELGKRAVTLNAEIEIVKADRQLASHLHIPLGSDVLQVKRVRGADEDVFAYFISYIPYKKEYSLDSKDYYGSFYQYLERFGIIINQERAYIEAVLPTPELKQALSVKLKEPLLKRVRMTTQKESDFYEYSECYYIGAKYRYYVDFL
ncbi:GntR family transcriptional regulator [Listeria ilorinensis]|uniref:GntR family transcriptional regulator n=1 Tax=Listeria ilorinensis TaxID=2867439 RepID=UPI001EF5BF9A|nr:GntR family transcriptional regulator [Listeria ilorinensis]